MLALQWVAVGVALVLLDVSLDGWDLLPDPLGWLLVVLGLLRVRAQLGPVPVLASAAALLVSAVLLVPGVLRTDDPALAWGLSLPQVVALVSIALATAAVVPQRRSALRLCGWLLAGVGLAPALVLGGGTAFPGMLGLVGLLAFVAVLAHAWLVALLLLGAPAVGSTTDPSSHAREGRP